MSNRLDFEVQISGTREGQPLTPELLDIEEWIGLMQKTRDLLYPEGGHPRLGVRMEQGSIRLVISAEAGVVIQTQALLEELNRSYALSLLKQKQQDAIYYFQQLASLYSFNFQIGESQKLGILSGLFINPHTSQGWKKEKPIWVEAEIYIKGIITSLGGKTNPNIHLSTSEHEFGALIIAAPQALLAEDEKNRLYKEQQLRIRILQNLDTGKFEPKSAELIEFIDFDDKGESPDDYLDRLIQQASKNWSKVEDPEKWLKRIRGYED